MAFIKNEKKEYKQNYKDKGNLIFVSIHAIMRQLLASAEMKGFPIIIYCESEGENIRVYGSLNTELTSLQHIGLLIQGIDYLIKTKWPLKEKDIVSLTVKELKNYIDYLEKNYCLRIKMNDKNIEMDEISINENTPNKP